MYEQYIGKKVKLITLEHPRGYDFEGHAIGFNAAMVIATKSDPHVEVVGEVLLSDETTLMRARFSDGQVWCIIPDWIVDNEVALFV